MPSRNLSLLPAVQEIFRNNGWLFYPVPGAPVIEAGFEAHHGRVMIHVQAYDAIGALSVVAVSPVLVPAPAARGKLSELLMRANERINLGAFELRWDQGEVLFRIGNVFSDGRLDPAVVSLLVEIAIVEMDRIAPCLAILAAARPTDLLLLDAAELLSREDLVPAVEPPEGMAAEGPRQ
jgi:hypothetical protein